MDFLNKWYFALLVHSSIILKSNILLFTPPPVVVTAVIFLAPLSAFDQVLAEDPQVNRLEDTLLLWRSLMKNPLWQNMDIILFLNKLDILKVRIHFMFLF